MSQGNKYKAILKEDGSNDESIYLEFDQNELEDVLIACEAVLMHSTKEPSVYISRSR